MPHRIVGVEDLAAQGVHGFDCSLQLVKPYLAPAAARIGSHGVVVEIFKAVFTAVGVRLADNTVLGIIGVFHLPVAQSVIPLGHAALGVVDIAGLVPVCVGEADQPVALILIFEYASAKGGNGSYVAILIAFYIYLFPAGQHQSCEQSLFVPLKADAVAVRPLEPTQQPRAGKGVYYAILVGDLVFVCLGPQAHIIGFAAGIAAVRPGREYNVGSARCGINYLAAVVQAQVLRPGALPFFAEGAVCRLALSVVSSVKAEQSLALIRP